MLFMNVNDQDEVGRIIQKLIDEDRLHYFYTDSQWLILRADVLKEFKYECVKCKSRGIYTKATHVHHVQWVRRHPRLAMSKYYEFNGKIYRNLIPLCHDCHEEEHPHRGKVIKGFLTEERW